MKISGADFFALLSAIYLAPHMDLHFGIVFGVVMGAIAVVCFLAKK